MGQAPSPADPSSFYRVIPHDVMVFIFGTTLIVAIAALLGSVARQVAGVRNTSRAVVRRALRSIMTLEYLSSGGVGCTYPDARHSMARRWFHHCTYYGFLLCFASTSIAAIYHVVFGWRAPYAYSSAPVVLGTIGGVGLMVGPLGLLALRRRRDPHMTDPAQRGLDESFIVMLCMTSVTGLLLLGFREQPAMPALLVVHLGFVLGLFLTLPYGKFVHGLYRMAALLRFSAEAHR